MIRNYKLFLDDDRYPPDNNLDWHLARNYDDAVWYVKNYGVPSFISFDHDLGAPQNRTGMDFAKWFCNYLIDNPIDISKFDFYVHSQNPVGAKNIQSLMDQFVRNYDDFCVI